MAEQRDKKTEASASHTPMQRAEDLLRKMTIYMSDVLAQCPFLILDEKTSGGIFIELSIAGNVNTVTRTIFVTTAAKTVPVNRGITKSSIVSRSEAVSCSLTDSARRKCLRLYNYI